ncbi:hypothetical protein DdX_16504 [Ditylenchus destructor]|uniref:Uncharacterized protein n=1 Tax=Ditylenchus destructor TaxID=166010 RepID=A0AAD4MNQ8_9BILA|nr:hypothetical protein DdX_16504 [Ditylenchus destructor]
MSDEDHPCSNHQTQSAAHNSELEACRKEKGVLENVNRDLRMRLRMAELKANRLSQRDYRKQVEHDANLETKLNECRSELAASRQENKETVDAKNNLKVELEIEQEKTRQLKESSFWLKCELKDSKRKLELSENALVEARQKKEEAQKKSTEWSQKAELQAVFECETEVSKAHSFNEKENILKETTQKLAETVFNLKKEQVRGSDMEAQLTRQREEVEILRQKVTFYRQTCKTQKQDCSGHLSSLAKFQSETEQLRKHEMELRQQNAELRNQNGESDSQIRELKQKLTESETIIARLEADKKLKALKNRKLIDELQSISNTKRMEEQSNFGLNLELQESKTKLELSENAIAEARKESRELSEKTSKLETELEQLRKHEMELRHQNAELSNQIGESERQIQQLKQKLTESEAAISRLEADKLPEATAVSQGLKHRTPVLHSKKLSSLASVNEEPAESQSDIECRTSISRMLEPSSSPSPDSAMHLKTPKFRDGKDN